MTANRIVRQGRAVCTERLNMSIRQKSQFDKCLEAVANAESQAVPLIQKGFQCIWQCRAAEQCGNKFAGTFRFITGTEAAWEHDNLCVGNPFCHFVDRCSQVLWRIVAQYHDICYSAGLFKCCSRIVFAVGPWAYRNEYARFAERFTAFGAVCRKERQLCIPFCTFALNWEYFAKRFFPSMLQVCQGNLHAADFHRLWCICRADTEYMRTFFPIGSYDFFHFYKDRTVTEVKKVLCRNGIINCNTNAVAKCHLSQCCCRTALTYGMHCFNFSVENSLMQEIAVFFENIKIRHVFCITRQIK